MTFADAYALLRLPATLAFDVKGRIDLSAVPGSEYTSSWMCMVMECVDVVLDHSIPIGSKVTLGHSSKSALVRHDGSFEL
jgi:hypothetical protein